MKNKSEFDVAKQLLDDEYYLDAIKILKKLNKLEPQSNLIKFELARAWIISGIHPERGEKYLQALDYDRCRIRTFVVTELGRISLIKKNYKQARKYLEKALNDKSDHKNAAYIELTFLNIREEKYEEAYKCFSNILKGTYPIESNKQIENYLKYKMGDIEVLDSVKQFYFYSQLINYDEEEALKHISSEHVKLRIRENDKKVDKSIYFDSINIKDLYDEVKIKLTNINPWSVSVVDKYRLEYNHNIGTINDEEVNCLSVITFPNTTDIITMYPIHNPKTRIKK